MASVITVIAADGATTVNGEFVSGQPWVHVDELERAVGWVLKDEGLCRDEVCIPTSQLPRTGNGSIDLVAVAKILDRPSAVSESQQAVYLAAPTSSYHAGPESDMAPDFTLPDVAGARRSLSEHRGKKVLLAAWASW